MGKEKNREYKKLSLLIHVFGLLTALLGLSAILGWFLDIPQLASFDPSKIPMAFSTACLFEVYGLIILFYHRLQSSKIALRFTVFFSYFGIILALLIFYLSMSGIRLHAEHLGIILSAEVDGLVVGHMSPVTAFCFVLTGLSFLLNLVFNDRKKISSVVLVLPGLLLLISIIILLSYLFGTPLLYEGNFIPPSLPASLAFLFLGIALLLISVLRVWEYDELADALNTRHSFILVLIFTVVMGSIITVGYSYYKGYEKHYRLEIERQLSSIADLKIGELVQWRKERLGDASIFYQNSNFSGLVKNYFRNTNDLALEKRIRIWMNHVHTAYEYNRVCLHDTDGKERLFPNKPGPHATSFYKNILKVKKSGQVHFEDFYLNEFDKHIYMSIFIPILDPGETNKVIGVLALRLDPEQYLYPLINKWPTPSKTAETLIVRREGEEVVFLNELRFQKNAALNLRRPVTEISLPAVQAGLGKRGIFEGIDYRGVPVIAFVCPIPNSPWALVARMDVSEIFAPLRERLWILVVVVFLLMVGTSSVIGMVWHNQRINFYKERYQSTEKIRRLNRVYAILSDINQAIVRIRVPKELFVKACEIAVEKGGFLMAWIGKSNLETNIAEVVASAGINDDYFGKINLDHIEQNLNPTPIATAIKNGHHVISNDCQNDEKFLLYQTDCRRYGYKSIASFPLIVNNKIWGAYSIYSGESGFFDDDEIKLLDELAMDLSFAIEFAEKEAERMRTEEKFRNIFENSPLGKSITGVDGSLVVNKSFCNMLGYKAEELSTKNWQEITHPDDIQESAEIVKSIIEGERLSTQFEKRYLHKDGRIIQTEVSTMLQRDNEGKPLYFITTINNITERKRVESALIKSEEFLSRMIGSSHDCIKTVDLNGNLLSMSKGGQTLLEIEDITKYINKSWVNFWKGQDYKDAVQAIEKAKNGEVGIFNGYCETEKGTPKWWEVSVTPINDESGKIESVLAISRDVTERKLSEEKLKESLSLLRIAGEKAKLGGWSVNLAENRSYWSDEVAAIHEMPAGYSPLVEDGINFYAPEWRERITKVFTDCAKHGISYDEEMEVITSTSKRVWVQTIGEAVRDDEGKIYKVHGAFQDITERKRVEQTIRDSEELFSKIFKNSPTALSIARVSDGKLTEVNDVWCQLMGFSREEALGYTVEELKIIDVECRTKLREEFLSKGRLRNVESEITTKTGEKRNLLTWAETITMKGSQLSVNLAMDITERKQALEELRLSEELFSNAFHIGPAGMTITRISDGKFIDANESFLKMFELNREEVIGRTSTELNMWTLEESNRLIQQLESGGLHNFELLARSKSGRLINLLFSSKQMTIKGEACQLTTMIDITERKRVESELIKSEEFLSRMISSSNDCIKTVDLNGNLLSMSKGGQTLLEIEDISKYVNKSWVNFWKGQDYKDAVQAIEKAKNGEVGIFNGYCETEKGTPKWWEVSVTPIKDESGKIENLLAISRDITERKQAEEVLRISEEKFRNVFENSPLGKSMTGIDGSLRVNKTFCDILGYSEEELKQKKWQEITYPDDIQESATVIKSIIEGERSSARFEKRYLHKEGRIVWTDVSTALQRDREGKPIYFITTIQDITERKRTEQNLAESEKRYRSLFENMNAGFVLFEAVQNKKGIPVDLIIIAANEGFEKTTTLRLRDSIGKLLTQVLPGIENDKADWIGTYSKVALSGESIQFEQGSELLGLYFSISAFQAGPKQCAVTFVDITERKHTEDEIKKRVGELELFHAMSVGREKRMIELKQKINELSVQLGKEKPYPLAFLDETQKKVFENNKDKTGELDQ